MAYVLDENNPPNPEWRSFKYLKQFAKERGTNPQVGRINREATNWYNAIGRKKLQGLWTDIEIVGFDPSQPEQPPPARRVYHDTLHGFPPPPRPPPPPPPSPPSSNPQGFAIGGSIHSSHRKSFFK